MSLLRRGQHKLRPTLLISFVSLLLIILLSLAPIASAQLVNGGFETGDFTGWTTDSQAVINSPAADPYVPSINKVHDGLYAAQIGDDHSVCPGDPNWDSWIEQSATVQPHPNDELSFWYAVVTLGAHATGEAAAFVLTVTVGNVEVFRSTNEAYDTPAPAPGWIWVGSIGYYDWTQVSVDLSAYVGQTVTLRFLVQDCIYCAHWAYGYLDGIGLAPPQPVIPEVPLGTIMVAAAMIIALIGYIALPRFRKGRNLP